MEALEAQRLLKEMHEFCSYKLRVFLAFDDVDEITDQILRLPEDDIRNFIRGYINPDKSKQKKVNSFINELISKKRKHDSLLAQSNSRKRVVEAAPLHPGLTVYKKERFDEKPPGLKKKKEKQNKKAEKKQRQLDNKTKVVRKPCDCQALDHPLVGNCLQCGKIICTKEGEGPCLFCGASEGNAQNTEEIQKAKAHRDKLIKYGSDAKVTRVYDDQADHFEYHGNQWLSTSERALLEKRQEENDAKIKEKQRSIVVTFDIAGRQIIQEEDTDENMDIDLDPFSLPEVDKKPGTFQNPFLQSQKPVFRKSSRSRPAGFLETEGIKQKSTTSRVSKTISCTKD